MWANLLSGCATQCLRCVFFCPSNFFYCGCCSHFYFFFAWTVFCCCCAYLHLFCLTHKISIIIFIIQILNGQIIHQRRTNTFGIFEDDFRVSTATQVCVCLDLDRFLLPIKLIRRFFALHNVVIFFFFFSFVCCFLLNSLIRTDRYLMQKRHIARSTKIKRNAKKETRKKIRKSHTETLAATASTPPVRQCGVCVWTVESEMRFNI